MSKRAVPGTLCFRLANDYSGSTDKHVLINTTVLKTFDEVVPTAKLYLRIGWRNYGRD